jgi:hypothetical protein
MLFPAKELRLIGHQQGTAKATGNPYAFVKLADEKTYENITLSLHRDQLGEVLALQTNYSVVIEATESRGNTYNSAMLTPIRK